MYTSVDFVLLPEVVAVLPALVPRVVAVLQELLPASTSSFSLSSLAWFFLALAFSDFFLLLPLLLP